MSEPSASAACTCRRDPLDNMPLVDAACPAHGRGPVTEDEKRRAESAAYRITFEGHVVEFVPSGFQNFESATCKTCRKFLCCGFPPSYTHHAAENHAGVCECKPSLVTWT